MADDGGLGFLVGMGLDKSALDAETQEALKAFQDLYKSVEEIGKRIDEAAKKGLNATVDEIKETVVAATEAIGEHEEMLNDLNSAYQELTAQFNEGGEAAEEMAQSFGVSSDQMEAVLDELGNTLGKVSKGVDGNKKALTDYLTTLGVGTDKAAESQVRLRTRIRDISEELMRMRVEAYEAGGEQAVAAVKASEEYQNLAKEAATMRDIMGDVNQELNKMAHDNGTLQGVISGVSGVAGAFSVAQGAMSLFGAKSEELQQSMMKVQSLMAVMMGLQQVANTFNKDSAFMTWLSSLKAKTAESVVAVTAQTAATTANSAAEEVNAKANREVATTKTQLSAATKGATTSTTANTAATAANTAATGAAGSAGKKLATSTTTLGGGLKTVTALIKTLTSSLLGWVGIAVAVAAAVISHFRKAKEEAEKASIDIAKASAEAAQKSAEEWQKSLSNMQRLTTGGEELYARSDYATWARQEAEAFEKSGKSIAEWSAQSIQAIEAANSVVSSTLNTIRSHEADKDWKYTEEGVKIYTDYYNNLADMNARYAFLTDLEIKNLEKKIATSKKDGNKEITEALESELESQRKMYDNFIATTQNALLGLHTFTQGLDDENKRNAKDGAKKAKEQSDNRKRLNQEAQDAIKAYSKQLSDEEVAQEFERRQRLLDARRSTAEQQKQLGKDVSKELLDIQLKENELAFDKELAQLKKEEEDLLEERRNVEVAKWKAAHPNEAGDESKVRAVRDSITTLDEKQVQLLNNKYQAAVDKWLSADKAARTQYSQQQYEMYQSLIEQYGTYEQQKGKLSDEYNKKRRTAMEKGDKAMLDRIDKEYKKKLSELAKSFLDDGLWEKFFENGDELTLSEINDLIEQIDSKTPISLFGDMTDDDIKKLRKELTGLKESITDNNPFKQLSEAFKQFKEDASAENFQKLAQSLSNVADMFSSVFESVKDAAGASESVKDIFNIAQSTASGAASGGVWGALIGFGTSTLSFIINEISRGVNVKARGAMEEAEMRLRSLERTQIEQQRISDASFGASRVESLKKEQELQQRKIELLIEEQKAYAELSSSQYDEEEYNRMADNIENEREALLELQKATEDAIYGESIESAIERFGNAYTAVWEKGKDTATSTADIIQNTYKSILQGIVEDTLQTSGKIEEARKFAYAAIQKELGNTVAAYINVQGTAARFRTRQGIAAYEESGLSAYGISYDEFFNLSAEELMKRVQKAVEEAGESVEGIRDLYQKLGLDSENGRNAQAQGIATASQESVDELNGRMTAVQGHTFNLSENSNIMRDTVEAIYGSVQRIEQNTQRINDVYNVVASMQRNGITINTAN